MPLLSSLRPVVALLACLAFALPAFSARADDDPPAGQQAAIGTRLGPSGLPLPRFVSLKSGRVNSRIGPGVNYAIAWLYVKPGLPMEIIQEYDNWRRVRDPDGAEGWIFQSLLAGRRTAIAAPWHRDKDATIDLLARADAKARVVAMVEPGAIGTIRSCNGSWCEMAFGRQTGWIRQSQIWGAYPGELIED